MKLLIQLEKLLLHSIIMNYIKNNSDNESILRATCMVMTLYQHKLYESISRINWIWVYSMNLFQE